MSEERAEKFREWIWDYVFHNGEKTINEIATQLQSEQVEITISEVEMLANFEWFVVENSRVSIAKHSSSK